MPDLPGISEIFSGNSRTWDKCLGMSHLQEACRAASGIERVSWRDGSLSGAMFFVALHVSVVERRGSNALRRAFEDEPSHCRRQLWSVGRLKARVSTAGG